MPDRDRNKEELSSNKTELANRIAEQSKRMADSYQHVEDGLARVIRLFSTFLDKVLFNRKYSKLVALVLAVLLYVVVNYNTMASVYSAALNSSRFLDDVAVSAKYNSDTFELSGLPQTADINIVGDATSVTNAISSGGTVIANLEGLTEGVHDVKLEGTGFGDNVRIVIDPSTVQVVLKKKTTQQFELSYDFINHDKMESVYSVGVPEFEYSKVNVRASKDTLDSIAFVKALIDVSSQTTAFEQDAKLIAYSKDGQPVSADIVPETIHVKVPVTSPNKTVPISVQVTGEIQGTKAIETITSDQQTVTIYGSESVLSGIDQVVVTLNASTITKDSTILRPIVLPAGVNSSNINQITISVTLSDAVTKTIDNVPISYKNNIHNYKASQPENKTTTSVTVIGTENNVKNVTADSISVYIDMKDAVPGLYDFQLQVDQPLDGMVKYELRESTYQLNVLGETNTETESGSGSDTNNS